MSYRVFARKYRPQTFEEVVGQEHITRTLANAISAGRVAQAYLFVGPRGIGKTSTARILAKALNCAEGTSANPCGKCAACLEIAEGHSLDVLEIDGASNNGVENIRELRESAAYAPTRGPYKIYLIDEVHMLSTGAFNALLKTLEEPPEHVKFIFATTEAQKVPATITSRCQRFDLRRIPDDAIAGHLLKIAGYEKISLEPEAAQALARGAEGGLRDAESMLDQAVAFCGTEIRASDVMQVFGFTPREVVAGLLERILACDAAGALAAVAEQAAAGKDLSRLLAELISHLRDVLVAGTQADSAPAVPRTKLLDLLDHLAETEARMRWATDKKLQLDVAAIKAAHLLEQASLDDVLESLTALRGGAPPPARTEARPVAAKAAPIPAKPAATPAAPPPATAAEKKAAPVAENEQVDASTAWSRLASAYESTLMSRWLSLGVFAEARADGTVLVELPPSCRETLNSNPGEKGRKDAEAKLSQALGRKVKLQFEISGALPDPVIEEEEAPPEPKAPEAAAPPAAAPPAEAPAPPAADFKNDPLIKKALEIFRSEIQTAAP